MVNESRILKCKTWNSEATRGSIGETFQDIDSDNDFLHRSQIAQEKQN